MKLTAHELPRSYWRKVAERNGIFEGTYRMRIARGWSPEKAATLPPRPNCKPNPYSTHNKLRAAGLSLRAVLSYRERNPGTRLSDDEIIALMKERHARKTLKQKAKEAGIGYEAVRHRIRRGWSEEKALSTPIMSREERGRRHARWMKEQGLGHHGGQS